MFLIRTAFWLSLIVILLPLDGEGENENSLTVSKVIGAAQATFSDVSNICERNPEVCATGSNAISTFKRKASYGAGLIADAVSENPSNSLQSNAPVLMKPVQQPALVVAPRPQEATPIAARTSSIVVPKPVETIRAIPQKTIVYAPNLEARPKEVSRNTLTPADLGPVWKGPELKTKG